MNKSPNQLRLQQVASAAVVLVYFLFFPAGAHARLSSGLINDSRTVDWTEVGVVQTDGTKGIPHRATQCANVKVSIPGSTLTAKGDGITNDTAALQAALDNCAANQVVYIPTGKYYVSGVLRLKKSYTVRGDGPGNTVIDAHGSSGEGVFTFGTSITGDSGAVNNFSADAKKGDTSIALTSLSSVTTGNLLQIDQTNDATFVTKAGFYGSCTWCSRSNGDRAMGQIVEVTGVSGNTVQIKPALYWDYPLTRTPQALAFAPTLKYAGVEDLTVRCNNTGYHSDYYMSGVSYCWLKNVEGDYTDGNQADVLSSYRCEVRDGFFHDAFLRTPGSTDTQIFLAQKTSASLVENNILWRLHAAILFNWGASGNVVGYNYAKNTFDSNSYNALYADFASHGAHPMMNLWEGNSGATIMPDGGWGSSSHGTIFRNAFAGIDTANNPKTGRSPVDWNHPWTLVQQARAIHIDMVDWYYNIVGNVLGSPYYRTHGGIFMILPPTPSVYEAYYIYLLGYTDTNNGGIRIDTYNTALIKGNFDYVSGSGGCVRDVSNTSGTYNCLTSAQISALNLPPSFYLPGKPPFWSTSASPWPATGPDLAVVANTIPAQKCFNDMIAAALANTTNNPNGMLSKFNFNPTICYGSGVTGSPPAAPKNLHVGA